MTLGIQETGDKIKIKRAYAEQLKRCRPDEDPEGFQTLHAAYKQAINNIKFLRTPPGPKLKKEPINSNEDICKNSIHEEPKQSAEDLAWITHMEQNYKQLTELAASVISEPTQRNDLTEWQFLAQSQFILEPEFNRQLGMFIIDKVMKVNEEFRKLSKKKRRYAGANSRIHSSVMCYLNSIFHWNGQVNQLRYYLGDDITLRVLNSIESADHNADSVLAAEAVVGGQLKTSKKRNIDHSAVYTESSAAMVKLLRLAYWVNGIFIAIWLLLLFIDANKTAATNTEVYLLVILLYSLQTYGLYKKNKYAIWSLWLTAVSLTCAFPWGTYFGITMMIRLYKSRKFHNY